MLGTWVSSLMIRLKVSSIKVSGCPILICIYFSVIMFMCCKLIIIHLTLYFAWPADLHIRNSWFINGELYIPLPSFLRFVSESANLCYTSLLYVIMDLKCGTDAPLSASQMLGEVSRFLDLGFHAARKFKFPYHLYLWFFLGWFIASRALSVQWHVFIFLLVGFLNQEEFICW